MAQTGNFKSYERGTRYQTTQAMFTGGMYYSDAPIPEGAAKVLVNYDVGSDGISLKPRKGLQHTKATYATNPAFYYPEKLILLADKVCYNDDVEYTQVIYGIPVADDLCAIEVWTYKTDALVLRYRSTVVKVNGVDIKPTVKLNTVEQAVGCFIGDQYFFFDVNEKTLFYTEVTKTSSGEPYYVLRQLKPQATTLAQTQQMGFNMLSPNPYDYTDTFVDGESTMSLLSINAFDDRDCKKPAQQELILNQLYYYRVSYTGGGSVKLVFDWTATDTMEWQTLSEQSITYSTEDVNPKIVIPFRSSVPKAILRCTAYAITSDTSTTGTPLDVIWFSFDYQEKYTKPVNDLVGTYTLATAKCMTYWQNRLVVAGVKEDPSYLFMSAPELFEYFPFPHNADYLDEPIIAVHPLLDNLLVFTKSKLYLYTLDPTNGLTRKCIQTNLDIAEADVHLIKIVKNMAYFKSGLYYYMVVPKLNSTTGELTIAPVSRNIKQLFDAGTDALLGILKDVYPTLPEVVYSGCYNYLDYESIHNVYMYKIEENLYINCDLLYNTVKRTWTIYTYESCGRTIPYKADATKPGVLLHTSYVTRRLTTETNIVYTAYTPLLCAVSWNPNSCEDNKHQYMIEYGSRIQVFSAQYNNNQYIDTGAVDIESNYKKRFREIQFRVLNNSKESLDFGTEFFIDGSATSPKYDYEPIIDESSGTLTLTKVPIGGVGNTHIQGNTKLGAWNLSKDAFPGADVIKIRVPVSGKGYNSQIKINCNSCQDYTLLDITNVYRLLYSR